MNFVLNEHLGSAGPIKGQKAISADYASSVVKTRQHKRGQQKFLSQGFCRALDGKNEYTKI